MSEGRIGFRQRVTAALERQPLQGILIVVLAGSILLTFWTPYSNFAILTCFAVTILVSLLRIRGFRHLGFRNPGPWGKLFVTALILAVVIEFGLDIFVEPFVSAGLGEEIDLSSFDALKGNLPNTLIMLAIGWIVGGFLEEMFFRGFLLQEIGLALGGNKIAYIIGLVISSVLFGLPHYYQDTTGMIMTGLTGFILGVIFLAKGRNIWMAVLVHGLIDTIGITLIYFDKYEALRDIVPV